VYNKLVTNNKKGVVFIPFIITFVVLGIAGFLVYQNYQLKQPASNKTQKTNTSSTTTPTSTYTSKINASLSFLQECRKTGRCPEKAKGAAMSQFASVSIRFTHILSGVEIKSFEKLGVQFRLVDGVISQSGTIYGADVPWNKIGDVEKESTVLLIESAWQPGLVPPSN
jgi:hypothetical protein